MDIVEAIRNGQDGSYNPFTGETPTDGYMVGGVSWTLTVAVDNFDPEMVSDFIAAHSHILQPGLTATATFFVGWWTHEGRIYLDVSERVDTELLAWSLGVTRKEIAVWDVANSREISCTQSA